MKLSDLKEQENKNSQPQSNYGGEGGDNSGKGFNGTTLGERRGESSKTWVIIICAILCLIIFTDMLTDISLVNIIIGGFTKLFQFAKEVGEWIIAHSKI